MDLTLPVAVDIQADPPHGPANVIAGARMAADSGIPVILIGPRVLTSEAIDLEAWSSADTIPMDADGAKAVRNQRGASVVVAAEAVKLGLAAGMVSAGNTGATGVAALLKIGRLSGVSRPAIAVALPSPWVDGHPTVLLDAGFNPECDPARLVQFALMGAKYAKVRFGVSAPRLGLLSIGEEPGKGTDLVRETNALLSTNVLEAVGASFYGNVEGSDVLSGTVDVIVTDGFTGNVVLKLLEGTRRDLLGGFFASMGVKPEAIEVFFPSIRTFLSRVDPDAYGGGVLLGVKGICVISHGKASPEAICSAIKLAHAMAKLDLVGQMRGAMTLPATSS